MDLGQVFTSEKVASLMTNILEINKNSKILDPCFGKGVFLESLNRAGYNNVTGYEIDSELFSVTQNKFPQYKLINADFLSSQESNVDGIIMNPPYVRHEKINDLTSFGVNKKILSANPIYNNLPSSANLYMYFIIKGFSVLRDGGEMIVIFPSSWLRTRSGSVFQETMNNIGRPVKQIHISGEVFERNALVDVVILKLKKGNQTVSATPEYIKLEGNSFIRRDIPSDEYLEFKKPFSSIAKVRRGLTTGFNQMYINPEQMSGKKYLHEIISSPKDINGFSTDGAQMNTIFAPLDGEEDDCARNYIMFWKEKIINDGKPQTLVQKIHTSDDWYRLKHFDCKGIIFSYFVRNDMKFIMNAKDCFVRDNFYIIYPETDPWALFALLNNYYTFYQLECLGKKYGAGLLKLQRYDIEKLTFPDINQFSNQDTRSLTEFSKDLAEHGNRERIDDITKIISNYSKWDYDSIISKYNEKVKKRLEEA